MKDYYFRIAGFLMEVRLPEDKNIEKLLPSFHLFRCETVLNKQKLVTFATTSEALPPTDIVRVVDESENDLGYTRLIQLQNGYRIELSYRKDSQQHTMHTDARFTSAVANIRWEDPYAGEVLSSFLRIVYSQAVAFHGAVSIHAASVAWQGKAFLFMGKSGTGKSTHARLWLKCFPGSELLNDDNPTIRIEQGKVTAYGTPWSGKTPCYKNKSFPVGGMVRLQQTQANRFTPCTEVDAFITLLPGCSVINSHAEQYGALCDTLVETTALVPTGRLECLPDEEAARLCERSLTKADNLINNDKTKNIENK